MDKLKCPHRFTAIGTAGIIINYNNKANSICTFNACPHLYYSFDCGSLTCPHNHR